MKKALSTLAFMIAAATLASAQTASVIQGTVKKVDEGAKTVAVATANGAEEVVQFTDKTVVHGTVAGAKDVFRGLKAGSQVVVHSTVTGTTKTAVEVDQLGKDGLKLAEGTISRIDAGGKKVVVKTADGAEQTFDATEHAAADIGKATAQGVDKAGKYSCYYTEEGGKKIAHFFKKM